MNIRPSHIPQTLPGSRVKVVFAPGSLGQLGAVAKSLGARRVLLVTDAGVRDAGHAGRAVRSLYAAGVVVRVFDGVGENPTTDHVARGLRVARDAKPDLIVGLGGGSSMDCAKGINFLLTNGGRMRDYWGIDKASQPLLPLIAIPTTAGTGSEAQSFALITDPETHQKMACGDRKALPAVALLDPELTATQPPKVAAATGIDAVAHAVETAGCTQRTDASRALSREAWHRLEAGYARALADPADAVAREAMLLGAHLAGAAIENSMLGAAHACANPLTAEFGMVHGVAVGLMLPHVVRFNAGLDADAGAAASAGADENPYADLVADAEVLARRIEAMLAAGGLPRSLSQLEVPADALPRLAAQAATQWTAAFNPRRVGEEEFREIYRRAL